MTAATISYKDVDFAIFGGGVNDSGYSSTIDVFYFNSSGTFSKLDTLATLSVARRALTATTISYNGIDYAIFGGGNNDSYSNAIDIFYFNLDGTFSKLNISVTLLVKRSTLVTSTIYYNGVGYAIFGGGYNDNFNNTVDIIYVSG